MAGFLGIIGGSAIVSGGAAVTTTGVLAPAGAVALVGDAVVATAGVAVVASATANITAGDPNIQFSTNSTNTNSDINLDQKPTAHSQKLQNFTNSLYKGQDNPVEGKFHSQKGQEFMNGLNKLINSGTLDVHDKAIARTIVQDIANALAGK